MNGPEFKSSIERRSFLARLGVAGGVVGAAISSPAAAEQAAAGTPWRPARHAQDDWLEQIPGQHRFAFDTTTSDGAALAFHFATIYFVASQRAYGLKQSDLAVLIILRHKSTAFGFNDAMWMKYGKYFSAHADFTDPKTKEPPNTNLYAAMPGEGINTLIQRGVHIAVCQMSTETIARQIAAGTGGDFDNVTKELSANLVGNGHSVPAGIVAVNRAQERGYSMV